MDVTFTLTQRHVDAICRASRMPAKTAEQSDDDYEAAKLDFAQERIISWIDRQAHDRDLMDAETAARETALEEIKARPRPLVKGKAVEK